MDRRRLPAVVLPLPGRPFLRIAPLVVAGAALLGACSGSDGQLLGGENGEQAESAQQPGGEASGDNQSDGDDGTLAFGDGLESGAEADPPAGDQEPEPVEIDPADLPDLPAPEQVIPDVESSLSDPRADGEILDTVNPVDAETEIAVDRDGQTRNSAGELVGLDQPASLACANVEIALTALDQGDDADAASGLIKAADHAAQSEMTSVQEWSSTLAGSIDDGRVDDVAPLIGFLTACAAGGYEI